MERLLRLSLILITLLVIAGGARAHAQIEPAQHVVFFPTAARLNQAGDAWLVPIHGRVFELDRNFVTRRLAVHRLAREMQLEDDADVRRTISERAGWLLADNGRCQRIEVAFGEHRHTLQPSTEDGYFEDVLELPLDLVAGLSVQGRFTFRALLPIGDVREFIGVVTLVSPTGMTVISDIDDTIKITEVTRRERLLRRTFVEPFQAVEGMAERYQAFRAGGVLFWFVSAGPWQLYVPVHDFLTDAGFPPAVWHMKHCGLLELCSRAPGDDAFDYKRAEISEILRAFPERRYVLIGDSGEKDPEVYGDIARRFSDQIVNIAIRDVTSESTAARRYQSAFRNIPAARWQIFHDPAEIAIPSAEECAP